MAKYLLRRFINLIPTFLIATLLAWFVTDLAPGDFSDQFAFDQVDPGKAERIREQLGLDQPSVVRYIKWFGNVIGINVDLGGRDFSLHTYMFYQWQNIFSASNPLAALFNNLFFLIEGILVGIVIVVQTLWQTLVASFLLVTQFFGALFTGNLEPSLGTSMTSKGPVMARVWPLMINSLWLALPAFFVIYAIAIPIGVYSALRKYSIGDRILTVFSLLGLAVPNFFFALIVIAMLVQIFQANNCFFLPTGGMTSQDLSDLNVCGWGDFDFSKVWWGNLFDRGWHLIAPVLIVALSSLAGLTRVMRGQMLEVMGQDYIRTARAKGLSDNTVTYKHALRNAILVIIATIGGLIPGLLLGSGTVEFVMGWPGLTPLFIRSVFAQDVYVVMALLTVGVVLVMIGNVVSDIALALTDPRIRY